MKAPQIFKSIIHRVDLMIPRLEKTSRLALRGMPCRLARRVDAHGVTLLEVMVALGIVAIVLVAIYRLQIQAITMERISQFHTQAPLLAQKLVAEIELQTANLPATENGDFGDDYPGYTWKIETEDVQDLIDTDGRALLKQIDLQIQLNADENQFNLRIYRLVNLAP
jgi:general secretion pathway protein I